MKILSRLVLLLALFALLAAGCDPEPDAGAKADLPNCDGFDQDVVLNLGANGAGEYIIDDVNTDTDIAGLENIECIIGNLGIMYTSVNSLAGLESLKIIVGGLDIWDNNGVTSLNGLDNLTIISGGLSIFSNAILTNFRGLDSLKRIGGALEIADNAALTNLIGLDNLTDLGLHLAISENNALNNLTGLNNLTTVGTYLVIEENNVLPKCIVDEFVAGVAVADTIETMLNGSTDPDLCP